KRQLYDGCVKFLNNIKESLENDDNKNFEYFSKKVNDILKELLNDYPNNKIFLRLLRDIYYKKGDYQKCLAICEQLRILEKRGILENELITGKAYYFLKDYKKSKEHFNFIIENKEKFKNQIRFKDHYKEAINYFRKVKWY
ncbi:MAG: hypothetical protein N2323_07370, partial [candidate division WOR-3 bacterium]|nr:hypothetical protein [candidate division WOR-3 bacterium]